MDKVESAGMIIGSVLHCGLTTPAPAIPLMDYVLQKIEKTTGFSAVSGLGSSVMRGYAISASLSGISSMTSLPVLPIIATLGAVYCIHNVVQTNRQKKHEEVQQQLCNRFGNAYVRYQG